MAWLLPVFVFVLFVDVVSGIESLGNHAVFLRAVNEVLVVRQQNDLTL